MLRSGVPVCCWVFSCCELLHSATCCRAALVPLCSLFTAVSVGGRRRSAVPAQSFSPHSQSCIWHLGHGSGRHPERVARLLHVLAKSEAVNCRRSSSAGLQLYLISELFDNLFHDPNCCTICNYVKLLLVDNLNKWDKWNKLEKWGT